MARALIGRLPWGLGSSESPVSIGMAKAAVLPVPVWAQPIKSTPFSNSGMALTCIGVASEYPSNFKALRMGSIKFSCSNNKMCSPCVVSYHYTLIYAQMKVISTLRRITSMQDRLHIYYG
jgi:hypothetical protein